MADSVGSTACAMVGGGISAGNLKTKGLLCAEQEAGVSEPEPSSTKGSQTKRPEPKGRVCDQGETPEGREREWVSNTLQDISLQRGPELALKDDGGVGHRKTRHGRWE